MPLNASIIKHIERTLRNEGGYVNHPRDPGGETNLGITWPTLRRGIALGVVPADTTIRNLNHDQAVTLYYEFYYKPWEFLDHPGMRFQMFDAYVNHSPGAVVGWLQRALGVPVDGVAGPVTRKAAETVDDLDWASLAFRFLAHRTRYYTDLSTWDDFGQGWTRRMADALKYAGEDF